MIESSTKMDLRIYWDLLWRRKWIVIATAFVISVLGLVWVFSTKPEYEASSTILLREIDIQAQGIERLAPQVRALSDLSLLRTKILSPEILVPLMVQAKLKDDTVLTHLARVTRRENPDLSLDEIKEELLLKQLREKTLKIRPNGVNMMQIVAVHENPKKAYEIVKILTQIFIEESRRMESSGLESGLAFSVEQMKIYKKQMEDAEARLQAFRAGKEIKKLDNEQTGDDHVDELRTVIISTTGLLEQENLTLSAMNRRLGILNTAPSIATSPVLDQIEQRQDQKLAQLVALLNSNAASRGVEVLTVNTDLKNLDDDMQNELRRLLAGEASVVDRDSWFEREITMRRIRLLKKKKDGFERALQSSTQSRKMSLEAAPMQEMTERRLQTDADQARELYYMFLRQTQGSEIQSALRDAQSPFEYRIIEPAKRPLSPIGLAKRYKLLMVGFLGLGLGVVLVLGMEFLDRSFKTVEEIGRYIDAPVIGLMPKLDHKTFHFDLEAKDAVEIQRITAALTDHAPARNGAPKSKAPDRAAVILVTSSISGEGKSLFAASLAASISALKRSPVLLIDADLRRPIQHRLFEIENDAGLASVLEDEEMDVQASLMKTPYQNLFILPSGRRQRSPLLALTSQRFLTLIEQLHQHHPFIIIDSPPVLPVNDALILCRHMSTILYVVKAGATSREVVKRGVELIRKTGGPMPSIILNNVTEVLPYYYRQNYYKYTYELGSPNGKHKFFRWRSQKELAKNNETLEKT